MKQETRNWKPFEKSQCKLETGKFLKRLGFNVYSLKLNPGYTLIEFLIVIGIVSLSVGSVLLFLTSVIKGANQANVTAEVKQNGQNVLDTLQSQIRGAIAVQPLTGGYIFSPSGYTGQSGIFLTLSTGEKLTVLCFNSAAAGNNGWIGIAKDLSNVNVPNGDITKFSSITNQNAISGVDVVCTATSFQVNAASSTVNVVIVNFTANQGKSAPSRADFLANAQFKTTLSLRQYQ